MGLGGADGIADGIADVDVNAAVIAHVDGDVIAAAAVLGDGDIAGAEVQPGVEGCCAVFGHCGSLILSHIIPCALAHKLRPPPGHRRGPSYYGVWECLSRYVAPPHFLRI